MTENLHVPSTHGPQFPGTLGLTSCSVIDVHGIADVSLGHPLSCRHRPLHVQTRLPWTEKIATDLNSSTISSYLTAPSIYRGIF